MIAPAIPENEARRLEELFKYNVLDTPPEGAFDELTQLASSICGTPTSLVSLIDQDRQWFKSKVGMDAEQTPRSVSFCGHAIHQSQLFEVENASQDERFHDNPLVTGENGIRFYAGMPLQTPSGYNIGTLCVIDSKPRKLSPEQRKAMDTVAKQVIKQMELSLKLRELAQANQRLAQEEQTIRHQHEKILDSIAYAQKVQAKMLSNWGDFRQHFPDALLLFRPKELLSGDFFFHQRVGELHVVAVGDCTGHGVAGALLAVLSHEMLKEATARAGQDDPAKILDLLHQRFLENASQGVAGRVDALDLSLCVIDPARRRGRFAGAKNHGYLLDGAGNLRRLPADRVHIGESLQAECVFHDTDFDFDERTALFFLSDGLPDQFGGADGQRKFSARRVEQWLAEHDGQELPILSEALDRVADQWQGQHPQTDDMIVLGFRPASLKG